MGFSVQGMRPGDESAPTTVMRAVTDQPTQVIPLPRHASTADAATALMQALDRGELYRSTPSRKARRARRADRKRMQGGAKQYGKPYYIPAGTKRWWLALFFGLSFLFGAVQFLAYVAFCRWTGLLP